MKHVLSVEREKSFLKILSFLLFAVVCVSLCPVPLMGAEEPVPIIVMTTGKTAGETIEIVLNPIDDASALQIDWGDGNTAKAMTGNSPVTGVLPVDRATIKIYGDAENIQVFRCPETGLTRLDVSKLVKLEELWCDKNELTDLDLSKLVKLKEMGCQVNKITSLDISMLPELTRINCFENELTTFDVSKNPLLARLDCSDNKLTGLLLKGAIGLDKLTFDGNLLTQVDLSGLVNVSTLHCENNRFTTLDFTPLTGAGIIYCDENPLLTGVRVNAMESLKSLYIRQCPELKVLDVSGCPKLSRLECSGGGIEQLIIQETPSLKTVVCNDNYLTFATLPNRQFATKYVYSPQKPVKTGKRSIPPGATVDLSAQYRIGDALTTYTWKPGDGTPLEESTDYTVQEGIFTFLREYTDSIHAEMTNAIFENLVLTTENIQVKPADAPDPIIVMTTNKPVGEIIEITLNPVDEVSGLQIDWGNGVLTKAMTGNSAIAGVVPVVNATVKVYGDAESIGVFRCPNNGLTALDVSPLSRLEELWCDGNELVALDLSRLVSLKEMGCQKNKLTSLDVSKLTQLTRINCFQNEFSTLDVSKNPLLTRLDCSDNKLTELKLKGAINLDKLTLDGNLLTSVNFSGLSNVSTLHCENNLFHSLDLTPLTGAGIIYCGENPNLSDIQIQGLPGLKSLYVPDCPLLSKLDVSDSPKLSRLECPGSGIGQLLIENTPVLKTVVCNDNCLTFATLPDREFATKYIYTPQKKVKLAGKDFYAGNPVDLGYLYEISHKGEPVHTVYNWKLADSTLLEVNTDYTEENGVFCFLHGCPDSLFAVMNNSAFPELTLVTENIYMHSENAVSTPGKHRANDVYFNKPGNELIWTDSCPVYDSRLFSAGGVLCASGIFRNGPVYPMQGYDDGIYFVRIVTEAGVKIFKISNY